jgi:hypothetical protein
MDARKGMLWYLVSGAMELSWFLACAMLYSLATMHRPFPFFESIAAFALAGLLTRISTGKGWRIAAILGIEILGFACAALLMIHGIDYGSYPLLDGGWVAALLHDSRGVLEWFILAFNLILITILWVLGMTHARRPREYYAACNRFDLGLAAFFALFTIKLIALTKGETMAGNSVSLLFVFPFFLFGLLSIGMARMPGGASKAFLPGYRGIGVIASFVAAVLIGTGGVLLFFLPGLTVAAQFGYRALTVIGRPLASIFVSVMLWVFGARSYRSDPVVKSSPVADWDKITPSEHGWWMEILQKVLGWGLGGVLLLTLLLALAFALFHLLKWLLSRTEKSRRPLRQSAPSHFAALWSFWVRACMKFLRGIRRHLRAAELYGALLGWAGRSGFQHDRSETPLEFAMRLNARFPVLKAPIDRIIVAYNREVYGETDPDGPSLAEANDAWRLICSPRHWPMRLKGWFAGASSLLPSPSPPRVSR